MTPTRIYVKPLLKLMREVSIHGLSHITGGGLVDNIPRVLPDGLVVLSAGAWRARRYSSGCSRQAKSPMRKCTVFQLRHRHDSSMHRRTMRRAIGIP